MAKIIIREILKEKGISIKELAGGMGITPSAVSQILANPNPSIQQLERIANVIEVDVMNLFSQDFTYINGYLEAGENIYPVKSREQFVSLIDKVDGIVHIPSSPRQDAFKNTIMEFCRSSINEWKSGAMMMRYGVNEVFTLTFDSESKRFSLTQCVGNGEIKFNTFEYSTYKDIRLFIEQILSQIESVYEIGEVW
ncbi:MAG: helix-turn-helix transcriptional regulator [Paludibacteraceae bacterium]|nr:helix-turn-helix transcriptional regulator [Paludibacteraceae bacterium]